MDQPTILSLLLVAFFAPLVSSTLIIFLGKRFFGKASGWLAFGVMLAAFACSVVAFVSWTASDEAIVRNLPWLPTGLTDSAGKPVFLYLGVMVDGLTVAMMAMVTGISTLVHLYSIGYMEGDKRFERFFAYLSLFTFSMLGIVMSNSLIMLFAFWELVGLTSYLLIGFWFEKRGPQAACTKAFVMNRVGDAGFLIGFGLFFYHLGGQLLLPAVGGGSMFEVLKTTLAANGASVTNPPMWLTIAGIGLFFGAMGKSAQFPLHTWLPDAMEGPTPVSSIVHSATMVAAGVYLTGRIYPILTPGAHLFIATIGLITLVMAALMALVMTDIKRVLAYSTLSQLGYMILGMGVGSYTFALFHLFTHAFFKCCLFQCAGSVIHAMHHEQDMRNYGGLWRKMPATAICYFICTLAIAGASIPLLSFGGVHIGMSGFYSKDGILAGAHYYNEALAHMGAWTSIFWLGPLIIAFVTPFYMARSFTLTFLGKPRDEHRYDHAHEAPWTMVVPQLCLAVMAIFAAVFSFHELIYKTQTSMVEAMGTGVAPWVLPGLEHELEHGFEAVHSGLLWGFAWIICIGAGVVFYLPGMKYSSRIAALPGVATLYRWVLNKFYFDALYDVFILNLGRSVIAGIANYVDRWLVDGLVNAAGWAGLGVASAVGQFDNRVVDGAVNGAAAAAQGGGQALRGTQVGRIRAYVLLLFVSATLVALVVVVAALASMT